MSAWALLLSLLGSTTPGYQTFVTSTGAETHWDATSICAGMSDGVPPELDLAEVEIAVIDAFELWSGIACGPRDFTYLGITEGAEAEKPASSAAGAAARNMVVWVTDPADWRWGDGDYAITTVTARGSDGVILDADIELGAAHHEFTLDDPVPLGQGSDSCPAISLQNTLVHEVGHVFGLDHSLLPAATMYRYAGSCDTEKVSLSDDDVQGYCYLVDAYPPTDELPGCPTSDPSPDAVEASETELGAEEGSGGGGSCCVMGRRSPGARASTNWSLLGALASLMAVRRLRSDRAARRVLSNEES